MAVGHGLEMWPDCCCCCWSIPRRASCVPSQREGHPPPPPPQGGSCCIVCPLKTPLLQCSLLRRLGKLVVQVLLLGMLETSQDPVPSMVCTGVSQLSVLALCGIKHHLSLLCSSPSGG